jgi:hypothetical protein
MTQWGVEGVGSAHLNPNAVVAFVDGELSDSAAARARRHLGTCPGCAAEVEAQREVRGMVRQADPPHASAGLLSVLREIPDRAELPDSLDALEGLAMTSDGKLVTTGSSEPRTLSVRHFGVALLGEHHRSSRRAVQGATAVVSGLVLGAIAFVAPNAVGSPARTHEPRIPQQNAVPVSDSTPTPTSTMQRRTPAGGSHGERSAHGSVRVGIHPSKVAMTSTPSEGAGPSDAPQGLVPAPREPVGGFRLGQPQP